MSTESITKTIAHVSYALHAASFFVGITAFVAVILNYIKRSDARDTWLESHFTWQIRTFWWSLIWGLITGVISFFMLGLPVYLLAYIWYVYRIIKGWLRLKDDRAMYS